MLAGRLHHVSFPVSDLERARHFYEGVLGLEPTDRPPLPFPGAWYRAGQCEVHLIVPFEGTDLGTRPSELNPLAPHTAFAIESYQETLERLHEHGVAVFETSVEMGQMWVQDPDGNVIELIVTPTAQS
jgi:glyoxylase I family protein